MQNEIINALFETKAIRVCPADHPFWYTSGLFGPYYVNTHFLFGSEEAANDLLAVIEKAVAEPLKFPAVVGAEVAGRYETDPIYHSVIDSCVAAVKDLSFDFVSGGERRDFFFSLAVAQRLGKPHLSIFKDGSSVYTDVNGVTVSGPDAHLEGQVALHVVDLVTQASSYIRGWIPAIEGLGAKLNETLAVVDRNQDGEAILADAGVKLYSLALVSEELFEGALAAGLIDEGQMKLIRDYTADPIGFVKDFVAAHPHFLKDEIAAGGKAKERAERLLASDYLK